MRQPDRVLASGRYALLGEDYGLGEHFEMFIDSQIRKGHYATVSDAVEDGLRLLEEREKERQVIRQALIEGEKSGRAEFSLESINEELDKELDKQCRLTI